MINLPFGVDVYLCLPHIYGSGYGLLLGLPHYISWFFAKPVNMHEGLTIYKGIAMRCNGKTICISPEPLWDHGCSDMC